MSVIPDGRAERIERQEVERNENQVFLSSYNFWTPAFAGVTAYYEAIKNYKIIIYLHNIIQGLGKA